MKSTKLFTLFIFSVVMLMFSSCFEEIEPLNQHDGTIHFPVIDKNYNTGIAVADSLLNH